MKRKLTPEIVIPEDIGEVRAQMRFGGGELRWVEEASGGGGCMVNPSPPLKASSSSAFIWIMAHFLNWQFVCQHVRV